MSFSCFNAARTLVVWQSFCAKIPMGAKEVFLQLQLKSGFGQHESKLLLVEREITGVNTNVTAVIMEKLKGSVLTCSLRFKSKIPLFRWFLGTLGSSFVAYLCFLGEKNGRLMT